MGSFSAEYLIRFSILMYLLSAVVSIVLIKKQKLCNIICNIICIVAAIVGILASFVKLFYENAVLHTYIFRSAIPMITIDMYVDNLSAFFILSLSILVLCVSIYSIGYMKRYIGERSVGVFYFLYSAFILSIFFVITSANSIFFFIAWELMAMISYFLVIFECQNNENQKTATLYIVMTHIATAFLLIGFMIIYSYTKSFDIFSSSAKIPQAAKDLIFVLFLIGFGTKAGVIPFHIWLPRAYPAAPSNVSAIMSGIMSKTAIYGMIRFVLFYLGVQNTWWGIAVVVIGIISAVLGISYAFVENNIKRLLAYSSIENIGIIFIGVGVAFISYAQKNLAVSALAITASLVHCFNHTLFKGSLFLTSGSIQYATNTINMEELGGLIKKMPVTAVFALGGALSISAIVPFNGFIGEWLTYQAVFANMVNSNSKINILLIVSVAALAIAGALAVASFVKFFGISFLGLERSQAACNAKEVPVVMNIATGILVALCLIVGLFPMLILKAIDKAVLSLIGVSVFEQLKGGVLIAHYPLNISGNIASPATVLLLTAAIILLSLLIIRAVGGKYIERKFGTWDCGFGTLNSRMQYSSTGFSKPIKIAFKILFKPSRKTIIDGELKYHPQSIEYKTNDISIFETYIYTPLFKNIKRFSQIAKLKIQTGSIHSYLIYIFAVVLIFVLYNRFV